MVTLNKPSAGDTDWTTEINDNWTTIEDNIGSMVLVEKKLITVNSTTVTFSGLDGDVDDVYYLTIRNNKNTVGGTFLDIQPNGITTNQDTALIFWINSVTMGNKICPTEIATPAN